MLSHGHSTEWRNRLHTIPHGYQWSTFPGNHWEQFRVNNLGGLITFVKLILFTWVNIQNKCFIEQTFFFLKFNCSQKSRRMGVFPPTYTYICYYFCNPATSEVDVVKCIFIVQLNGYKSMFSNVWNIAKQHLQI